MTSLLAADQLSRGDIETLLHRAAALRDGLDVRHPGRVVGLLFLDVSLRTRVGFAVAATRLGANPVTLSAVRQSTLMGAPETLEDTVRSVGAWFDALCVRHPDAGAAARVAAAVATPVINRGDGQAEHPTQALVDLFALRQHVGDVDGLRIGIVGDLHAMRSAHSFATVLAAFNDMHVRCMGPAGLDLPEPAFAALRAAGHVVERLNGLELDDLDVIYVAGLPAETAVGTIDDTEQARFRITVSRAQRLADHVRVLCPLPRVDEIEPGVDELPQAAYFAQTADAQWVRMAVLDHVLSGGPFGS